jgi:transposase
MTRAQGGAYKLYVGVDVAAATVTAAWMAANERMSIPITVAQTTQGYTTLQERLAATGLAPMDTLVVLEATGSYWITLATTLAEAGYGVSVVNPKRAHNFAKVLLKRAKTDAIDAQTLARLGALLQPAPWTPPPAIYTELQQRLVHRDALIAMRQQLRNQLHALIQQPYVVASVRARLEVLIATLTSELTALDREIAATLVQDTAWAEAAARLQTITGVGVITTAWLLTATLNFTLCPTPEAATAYAGLAPHAHQSGTSVHKRSIIGHTGHARLRTVLYLASLSAAQHNSAIKPFYDRLRAAGKSAKVARCAAARKLLHIAWAVATTYQPFDPEYHARPVAVHDTAAHGLT